MSWNLNTEGAIPLSEADVAIDELGITGASPEVEEQISAAKAAAKSLLASGAVGNGEDVRVSVGINGHANPDHAYSEGMAQDTISVSVRQTPPVLASPPAEPANEGTTGEQAPAGEPSGAPAPGDASDQLATPPAQENPPVGGGPVSEEGSAGVQ